jgi:type IV secretory pathway VirB2 component (pilin)
MKASTSLLTIALASIAYGCNSSAPRDDSTVAAQKIGTMSATPMAVTSMTAPGAVAGGVATQFTGGVARVAEATDAVSPESPPAISDPLQNVNASSAAPTMVIRTGQAFIEVEKVDAASLKIRQLAAQVGGYITNSSVSGGRDQIRQATFELKIPAPKYDQAADLLPTIGKVETLNSTAQDVGEEFVDVTARVTNSRRLEERLISLLANRTGKLDEVLRVERELARVREEIERYEGRLRYLSARVALSTLTITVHEPAPILGNSPGENPIAAALRRAWKNFITVIAGSIAALGVVIPLLLLGLAGWLGYRRWKRR